VELAPTLNYYVNLDYTQLAVDYWAQIGVDVEIDTMEVAVMRANINNHTHQGITQSMRGVVWSPLEAIRIVGHSDAIWNAAGLQDPVYDAMVEAAENAGSTEEMMELVKEADMYLIKQQWTTWGPMRPNFIFWQPWMAGYNGERTMGGGSHWLYLSRVWLDSDLKEAMGH
jgi:ABC-type oligopeptide transport system substrate-binding subunit